MMLGNSAGADNGVQMESSERERARDKVSVGGHALGERGGGSSGERGARGRGASRSGGGGQTSATRKTGVFVEDADKYGRNIANTAGAVHAELLRQKLRAAEHHGAGGDEFHTDATSECTLFVARARCVYY